MKTLCGIAVVGLVLLLMAPPCTVAALDGNGLLEGCRDAIGVDAAGGRGSPTEAYNAGYCRGFVDGMLGMHRAYYESLSGSSPRPLFCLPGQGIRLRQGMRVVLHYLETHPERLHLDERVLFIDAIRDAFPCAPAASQPQR